MKFYDWNYFSFHFFHKFIIFIDKTVKFQTFILVSRFQLFEIIFSTNFWNSFYILRCQLVRTIFFFLFFFFSLIFLWIVTISIWYSFVSICTLYLYTMNSRIIKALNLDYNCMIRDIQWINLLNSHRNFNNQRRSQIFGN